MPVKSFNRSDRVAAQLRRDLGSLVHAAVRDHGLPALSVSDVEVTRDLAHAKVYVVVMQSEQAKEAVKLLKAHAPELRYRLGQVLKLRHVPELHFAYDDSMDRGQRIDSLLREAPVAADPAELGEQDAQRADIDAPRTD